MVWGLNQRRTHVSSTIEFCVIQEVAVTSHAPLGKTRARIKAGGPMSRTQILIACTFCAGRSRRWMGSTLSSLDCLLSMLKRKEGGWAGVRRVANPPLMEEPPVTIALANAHNGTCEQHGFVCSLLLAVVVVTELNIYLN